MPLKIQLCKYRQRHRHGNEDSKRHGPPKGNRAQWQTVHKGYNKMKRDVMYLFVV